MLPLWIIDLNQDKQANEKLASLLGGLSERQRSYWHYTPVGDVCGVVEDVQSCKKLVSWIVQEGQRCVNEFRGKGFVFSNLQVCVLGHVQEELTQSVFHVLPNLLYDQTEKILSYHANRGVEITGMLTVPEIVNQMVNAEKRRRCALFLNELNLLVKDRGRFNRVILVQENQYVENRFYHQLDVPGQMELVFQYLVSAYFCGHGNSTIFANNLADERTFYSLGAASVYYDAPAHKTQSVNDVMHKIVDVMETSEVDEEYSRIKTSQLHAQFNSDAVSQNLRNGCVGINEHLAKLFEAPNPHPIVHFFKPSLWPKYFGKYFRYLPARLLEYSQTATYALYSRFGHVITQNADEKIVQLRNQIRNVVRNVTTDEAAENPTIGQQISLYNALIHSIAQEEEEAKKIQVDVMGIPKDLAQFYQLCEECSPDVQPEQIFKNLKKELKLEPTVLGALARSIIMGVAFCLLGVPLLKLLTPRIIYLGAFSYMEWLWYLIFFLLPFMVEGGIVLRRHFKRIRKYRLQLMAYSLWTVNKKLASHHRDSIIRVYQEIKDFCHQRKVVLEAVKEAISYTPATQSTVALPETKFNQPLLEGNFSGVPLFDDPKKAAAAIKIHLGVRKVDEMENFEVNALIRRYFAEVDVAQMFDAEYPEDQENFTKCLKCLERCVAEGSEKCIEECPAKSVEEGSEKDDMKCIKKDITERVEKAVTAISKMVVPRLDNIATNIGEFYAKYRSNINLKPLLAQAGLNGMFVTGNEYNPILARMSDTKLCQQLLLPDEPKMQQAAAKCCDRCCTDPYIMLVSWQEITDVDGGKKCGVAMKKYDKLCFSDKIAVYYAFYKYSEMLQGNIAETPIHVSRGEMVEVQAMMKELEEEIEPFALPAAEMPEQENQPQSAEEEPEENSEQTVAEGIPEEQEQPMAEDPGHPKTEEVPDEQAQTVTEEPQTDEEQSQLTMEEPNDVDAE